MARPLSVALVLLGLLPSAHAGAQVARCTVSGPATIVSAVDRASGPEPARYPTGTAAPASHRSHALGCRGGDATACNALADHYREASRDERRARALYDRAADIERSAARVTRAPASAISGQEALRAFRAHWSASVQPGLSGFFREIADHERACFGRDGAYRVRRVSRRLAHQTSYRLTHELGGTFANHLLGGALDELGGAGWVWEVMFGGGSNQLPPWGAFVAYVDGSGRVLVTLMWPEG